MNKSSPLLLPLLIGCWIVLTLTSGARADRRDETVWLSSLDLSLVDQGWGSPHRDRSVENNPLSIGGRRFEHGLGTHSPGAFIVDLKAGCSRFSAWVGIDDETKGKGSVEFEVIADGRLVWRSEVLRGGLEAKRVDLDVAGVHQLALVIDDAGDGYEFDHADWADAQFDVVGAAPEAIKPKAPDPTIAPPDLSAAPRLVGPSIIGLRRNAPALVTLAATGKRPLSFTARGLPGGLSLNSAAGRITGVPTAPGDYTVTVRAKNRAGVAVGKLRLVVGETIALTPPMGWNSYDGFGDDVTEAEILANARYVKDYLQPHGWAYVVVDYRWYDPGASQSPNNANARANATLAMDRYGRLVPAPNRFPSAVGDLGFRPLADQIHAMGLKFGIHIMRGVSRQAVRANAPIEGSDFHAADAANPQNVCGWCPDMFGVDAAKPAGQAWYDALLRQYAAWGVDFIKVDDMSSPYSAGEIEAMRKAIDRCGRAIVLSLSPGETPVDRAEHVQSHANMWRISGDFWDDWGALSHAFDLLARWRDHGAPGHWPDADMIPFGHLSVHNRSVGPDRRTNFTRNEQLTLMSLWALAPSPLMLGMNLPDNDPWTLSLLTNDEVLAVNQDASGARASRVSGEGRLRSTEVWSREMADGSKVIGLFNRMPVETTITLYWAELGFHGAPRVRDLWRRKNLEVQPDRFEATVPAHGAVLIRASQAK